MTCLTCGLKDTLSFPARAARAGFAPGPLGTSSWERASAVVGFWGIVGWTPSMASQCAGEIKVNLQRLARHDEAREDGGALPVKVASLGTLGRGALMSFSKSTSSSSI